MRLLFDEQLSNRLPDLLADCYPDSLHKDEDFHRLSVMHGAPPKVVWVRLGNCTTQDIVDLLRKHLEDVRQFATRTRSPSSNWADGEWIDATPLRRGH